MLTNAAGGTQVGFDFAGVAQSGCNIVVIQVSGVDTSGINGAGAVAQANYSVADSDTSRIVTQSALNTSGRNAVLAAFATTSTTTTWNTEPGWTTNHIGSYTTPQNDLLVISQVNSTDNTATATNLGSAQSIAGIAIEINAATNTIAGFARIGEDSTTFQGIVTNRAVWTGGMTTTNFDTGNWFNRSNAIETLGITNGTVKVTIDGTTGGQTNAGNIEATGFTIGGVAVGGGGLPTFNANQFASLGGSTNLVSGVTLTNAQANGFTNAGVTALNSAAYTTAITNSGAVLTATLNTSGAAVIGTTLTSGNNITSGNNVVAAAAGNFGINGRTLLYGTGSGIAHFVDSSFASFNYMTFGPGITAALSYQNTNWPAFRFQGTNASAAGNPLLTVQGGTNATKAVDVAISGGLVGKTDASAASAGIVGEVISSLVASGSAVAMNTGVGTNVTSISLTAGDWDVSGNVNFSAASATVTATSGGITTTSATVPTDGTEVYSGVQVTLLSETDSVTIPRKQINVSSTTTVYLVGKTTFSAGTVSCFGAITARRVR